MFHGATPRKVTTTNFRVPKGLIFLGLAHKIEYISDKYNGGGDGKEAVYVHEFAKSTKLYMDETGNGQLYIIGPKLKVREAGIIN